MRAQAGAWLAVALFVALTLWLVLGATARLIDRELDLFTDQTVAPAVTYQEAP